MNRSEALEALARCRVGHLATIQPSGDPHIVPITFAVHDTTVVTMVDHKPKSATRLQRLVNIERHPSVTVLADRYSEDWSELWWVRVDGRAEIHEDDKAWRDARTALADKYEQYRDQIPEGPAIVISIDRVSSWESTP